MTAQKRGSFSADAEMPEFEAAKADLARWATGGGEVWDLPASAVHFVLGCHGAESNPAGTAEALEALTDECESCCGEGYFRDDSHPANRAVGCDDCLGYGRVPVRAKAKTPKAPA